MSLFFPSIIYGTQLTRLNVGSDFGQEMIRMLHAIVHTSDLTEPRVDLPQILGSCRFTVL